MKLSSRLTGMPIVSAIFCNEGRPDWMTALIECESEFACYQSAVRRAMYLVLEQSGLYLEGKRAT